MSLGDLVINIKAKLQRAEAPVTAECSIYRVPLNIRSLNEDAYTPKVVSIGPFHHNSHPRLHNMERHKLLYCKAFLARTETKTSVDTWIRHIEILEPDVRLYYSDTLEFKKEELVEMIFLDAGFIFELFLRHNECPPDDRFNLKPWLEDSIRSDLLLLENQLPFSVIEGLFKLSFTSKSDPGSKKIPSFLELTFDYFSCYNKSNLLSHGISIRHFTDLIRTFYLQHPEKRRPEGTRNLLSYFPSATELSEAGVSFEENTKSDCLLDFTFSRGVFQIPRLKVTDSTERLFRNMVALEQCHYPKESYITHYVAVLDFLVNTSRDVDILVRKKVLVNYLGDTDSVAKLFNGLGRNITHLNVNDHYFHISKDVNDFYRIRWHKLKSTLRRDYCNNPWKTAASTAGILLLFFSLVQTICSVWQLVLEIL